MVGNKCCVPGCRSNSDPHNIYTPIFKFPTAEHRRSLWIQSMPNENFTPCKTASVCIHHFEEKFVIREHRVTRDDGSLLVMPRKKLTLTPDSYPTKFPSVFKQRARLRKRSKDPKVNVRRSRLAHSCCVRGCLGDPHQESFLLPTETIEKERWINALEGWTDDPIKANKTRICHFHFEKDLLLEEEVTHDPKRKKVLETLLVKYSPGPDSVPSNFKPRPHTPTPPPPPAPSPPPSPTEAKESDLSKPGPSQVDNVSGPRSRAPVNRYEPDTVIKPAKKSFYRKKVKKSLPDVEPSEPQNETPFQIFKPTNSEDTSKRIILIPYPSTAAHPPVLDQQTLQLISSATNIPLALPLTGPQQQTLQGFNIIPSASGIPHLTLGMPHQQTIGGFNIVSSAATMPQMTLPLTLSQQSVIGGINVVPSQPFIPQMTLPVTVSDQHMAESNSMVTTTTTTSPVMSELPIPIDQIKEEPMDESTATSQSPSSQSTENDLGKTKITHLPPQDEVRIKTEDGTSIEMTFSVDNTTAEELDDLVARLRKLPSYIQAPIRSKLKMMIEEEERKLNFILPGEVPGRTLRQ